MKLAASCLALVGLAAFAVLGGACSDQNSCSNAGSAGACTSGAAGSAGAGGAAGTSGSGGTAGSAGTAGTAGATGCNLFIATVDACYKSFCASSGSGSPFCACWTKGYDINPSTCVCIPLDKTSLCTGINLTNFDPATFGCAAAAGSVATLCVSATQTQ